MKPQEETSLPGGFYAAVVKVYLIFHNILQHKTLFPDMVCLIDFEMLRLPRRFAVRNDVPLIQSLRGTASA